MQLIIYVLGGLIVAGVSVRCFLGLLYLWAYAVTGLGRLLQTARLGLRQLWPPLS